MKEKMKLVDTSVWINYFRGKKGALYDQLTEDIFDGLVAVCPVIIQEVLQGVDSDKDFEKLRENFMGFELLYLDPVDGAIQAASLYRKLRKKVITIRKPNDCLIAVYAIFYEMPLLHEDKDFNQIARESALMIY